MSSNSQLVGKLLLDRKKKLFHESKNRPSEKNTNIKLMIGQRFHEV